MRVAILLPGGVDPSGTHGVIPALLSLIERLARRHQVRVIVAGHARPPQRYRLLGAEVIDLGDLPSGPPGLRFARRLQRVLSALGADRFDVLHAFWAGPTGALAGLAGKITRTPVLLSPSGGERVWLPEIGYGAGTAKSRALIELSLRLATAITAGSRYALSSLPAKRSPRWLPIGADFERFRAPIDRPPGPPWRLIQVASINRVKDPGALLRVLERVREAGIDATLDWAGEDTLGGEVQRLAAQLGLAGHVRFHGFLTQEELRPIYRSAHLYVQTSKHEAQGVSVLEAAASGVALAGTATGILAELAPRAAIAAPVGDVEALADAVIRVLRSPEERAALASAGQSFAREHDADWTAARFESLYEELRRGGR